MKQEWIIAAIILAGLAGGLASYVMVSASAPSTQELIKEYYLTENAVHVSPHSLRGMMDKGDSSYVLVDVRSREEYEREHVIGAVSIPAYRSPNSSISFSSDKEETQDIIKKFSELPKGKDIILYCYSMPCMTGRKVGKLLAENGIFVKTLNIGWNEWRYYWDLWNHEGENVTPSDYIATGPNPGVPKTSNTQLTCSNGQYGC